MSIQVEYHEARIKARGDGRAANVQVLSSGHNVMLLTRHKEQGDDEEKLVAFEMNVAETLAMVEGMLDAMGRCGLTYAKRNAALRKMELHPKCNSVTVFSVKGRA